MVFHVLEWKERYEICIETSRNFTFAALTHDFAQLFSLSKDESWADDAST